MKQGLDVVAAGEIPVLPDDELAAGVPDSGRGFGMLLMIVAAAGFATMGIILRGERSTIGPYTAMFWRGSIGLILTLPLTLVRRVSPWGSNLSPTGNLPMLALRGAAGAIALLFYFLSIVRVDLGTATALCYLNPIIASMLAAAFLKERITPRGWAAILAAWGGVVLMVGLKPWESPGDWASSSGAWFGLLSGFFSGVAIFTLRALRKAGESTLSILNVFFVISVLVALPGAWQESPLLGFQATLAPKLLGIALAATAAQSALTHAYRHLPTQLGGPLALVVLPFSMTGIYLLYGESPAPTAILGGVVLAVAVTTLARGREG